MTPSELHDTLRRELAVSMSLDEARAHHRAAGSPSYSEAHSLFDAVWGERLTAAGVVHEAHADYRCDGGQIVIVFTVYTYSDADHAFAKMLLSE